MPTSHVAFSMTHNVKKDILETVESQLTSYGFQFQSNLLNGKDVDDYINNEDGNSCQYQVY